MCYNGLNNMFFPLCQINDNHSVDWPPESPDNQYHLNK